jgi:hypothetical protein
MNTPKTPKAPKRWKPRTPRVQLKGGLWGICDISMAAVFGRLISYWPHVEEHMIIVFEELISGEHTQTNEAVYRSSREIFLSIRSPSARITVMRFLLQEAHHNKEKNVIYDEIIAEFDSLNDIRNQYVHGRWLWNEDDKILLFWMPTADTISQYRTPPGQSRRIIICV